MYKKTFRCIKCCRNHPWRVHFKIQNTPYRRTECFTIVETQLTTGGVLVSVCLSNEVAVRHRVEDGQTNGIHFILSVRLRLHHSSYLHVTYTLHVALENLGGNILTPLRHSASQRRMVNGIIYQCCCRRWYSEIWPFRVLIEEAAKPHIDLRSTKLGTLNSSFSLDWLFWFC